MQKDCTLFIAKQLVALHSMEIRFQTGRSLQEIPRNKSKLMLGAKLPKNLLTPN